MEPRTLFYTPLEAAHLLKVAHNTVLEAIRRGQLPALQIGDRYRIPAGQLYRLASTMRGGEPEMTWDSTLLGSQWK